MALTTDTNSTSTTYDDVMQALDDLASVGEDEGASVEEAPTANTMETSEPRSEGSSRDYRQMHQEFQTTRNTAQNALKTGNLNAFRSAFGSFLSLSQQAQTADTYYEDKRDEKAQKNKQARLHQMQRFQNEIVSSLKHFRGRLEKAAWNDMTAEEQAQVNKELTREINHFLSANAARQQTRGANEQLEKAGQGLKSLLNLITHNANGDSAKLVLTNQEKNFYAEETPHEPVNGDRDLTPKELAQAQKRREFKEARQAEATRVADTEEAHSLAQVAAENNGTAAPTADEMRVSLEALVREFKITKEVAEALLAKYVAKLAEQAAAKLWQGAGIFAAEDDNAFHQICGQVWQRATDDGRGGKKLARDDQETFRPTAMGLHLALQGGRRRDASAKPQIFSANGILTKRTKKSGAVRNGDNEKNILKWNHFIGQSTIVGELHEDHHNHPGYTNHWDKLKDKENLVARLRATDLENNKIG